MLIDDHDLANKGKIRGKLPLEHIFGFCISFKKVTKNLGLHITFETVNLQDVNFTSIGVNINVIYEDYIYIFHFTYQVQKLN